MRLFKRELIGACEAGYTCADDGNWDLLSHSFQNVETKQMLCYTGYCQCTVLRDLFTINIFHLTTTRRFSEQVSRKWLLELVRSGQPAANDFESGTLAISRDMF